MGFDHIRVCFDQIVVEEEPYKYREYTYKLLENFALWCRKYNLGCIFNLHNSVGSNCAIEEDVSLLESDELRERFVAFWVAFEKRFSHMPEIMFELQNEIRNTPTPEKWNSLYKKTIEELRKISKERQIIVGSTAWGSPYTLKDLEVLDDEYVYYTFNFYDPFEFTHQQGVLQSGPLYYNRKLEYPCDDIDRYRDYYRLYGDSETYKDIKRIDKELLRTKMQGAIDFVKAHPDKVLWNGEFGTIRHIKTEYRANYMRDVISICRENGIPYSVWNYLSTPNDGNRFSLVDDDTREILSEDLLDALLGK
jgi:endoglucanase